MPPRGQRRPAGQPLAASVSGSNCPLPLLRVFLDHALSFRPLFAASCALRTSRCSSSPPRCLPPASLPPPPPPLPSQPPLKRRASRRREPGAAWPAGEPPSRRHSAAWRDPAWRAAAACACMQPAFAAGVPVARAAFRHLKHPAQRPAPPPPGAPHPTCHAMLCFMASPDSHALRLMLCLLLAF